jgi:hypothetical protein
MNAMDELLKAYLVALVTTHGPGEEIREASVFLPRLVWLITSVALIAALALVGDRVRVLASQEVAVVIPEGLISAARMTRFRDTQESIRLFELRHGRFPMNLQELSDEAFQHEPGILSSTEMRYLADENGFRLEDIEENQ